MYTDVLSRDIVKYLILYADLLTSATDRFQVTEVANPMR